MSFLADVITADMGFLPGLAIFGPSFGLPLSLLAAIIERPFYRRAGVNKFTTSMAAQANFISLIVGYLFVPLGIMLFMNSRSLGIIWIPLSIVLSTIVERTYLIWQCPLSAQGISFKWIFLANFVSAFALVGILILSVPFDSPSTRNLLSAHLTFLTAVGIGLSAILFMCSFIYPKSLLYIARKHKPEQINARAS